MKSKRTEAQRKYAAAWYQRNRALTIERSRKYNAENKEQRKAYVSEWHLLNPEKIKVARKRWAQRNPEKVAAAIRRWRAENPVKVSGYCKAYRQRNPQKVRRWFKEWCERNPVRYADLARHHSTKAVREMSDSYIRVRLSVGTSTQARQWPAALVDLKRAELKLKRHLKTYGKT